MTRSSIVILWIFILTFPGTGTRLHSQDNTTASYRLLFYNTGNFFDTADDSIKEDNDFLPEGVMRWNTTRYKKKLNSIYKVIIASGGWEPPAIVGLCEVENRKVLNDLVYDTWLSKYNYGIVHIESNDPRGIDVAVIYRKDVVKLLASQPMIPEGYNDQNFTTRHVLYSRWLIAEDTVHLFLNHWPSRRGGVLAGEELRKSIAAMVRNRSDSIMKKCGCNAKIIIAGDFNCTPDDSEMQLITGEGNYSDSLARFKNLSSSIKGSSPGSYKYRGAWEMIDQVLVSESLIKSARGLYTTEEMTGIFSPDFLLRKDDTYTGVTPFATYTGYRYSGGFSDHLPVFLDLLTRQNRD